MPALKTFASPVKMTQRIERSFSIFFAIALGIGAAFIRRFFSDLRKKHFSKSA